MSAYSPTNAAPVEDAQKFYDDLSTAIPHVPAHNSIHHVPANNFLVILRDFNKRLGPEDAPGSGLPLLSLIGEQRKLRKD
ncbi:unnamed protein product [Boreogadus saida]